MSSNPRELLTKPAGMSWQEWERIVRGDEGRGQRYGTSDQPPTSSPPTPTSAPSTPSPTPVTTTPAPTTTTPTVETPAIVRLKVATDISRQLIAAGFGGYWSPAMVEAQLFGQGALRGAPQASDFKITGAGVATITGPSGVMTIDLADFNAQMKDYETAYAKYIADQAATLLKIPSYLSSVGIGGDVITKTLAAIQTTPAILTEIITASQVPTTQWFGVQGAPTPSKLSKYPDLAALGFTERNILLMEEPASAARAATLRISQQVDYLAKIGSWALTTQAANLSQLTGKTYMATDLETIYKTQAIGTEVVLPEVPKSFSELGFGEAVGRVAPLAIQIGLAYGGGVVIGAFSKALAPVAGGVFAFVGKADIFAKLATYAGPVVESMWAVEKGAIVYAAPYIAQQVGLIAMTGIETYKARSMYEAGVPIPDIALSVGMDVATVALFAKGFQKGYEMGLPPSVERAIVGTPKLFIKGEPDISAITETPFYKSPAVSFPKGAEAYYKRTGGLLSRLTTSFGQVPIEEGMVLPVGAVSFPSGEVSKEWGLVSSMRLQQIETWAKVQPFKLNVPLEKGVEVIDSRLIGVQALGDTQSIRYWAGVSAKRVTYTPFEGELFEPWVATKTNLEALKTYILAPKTLIGEPVTGWAQLQMDISRTIYPAGVLYPERPIGILDKEWYTTKMYDVGRAMDQLTSAYVITPGQVTGASFAKIQFELTPAQTYVVSGTGPIGYGAKALESVGGFRLSDSIVVAGGGAVQAPNWAQQAQLLRRQVELLEPAEEMFSPFMAHPLAGVSALQRGLPSVDVILGVGVGAGLLKMVSGRAAPVITFKQFAGGLPALTQIPTPVVISAIVPIQSIAQAPAVAQILATIQAMTLAVPTITLTTPAPLPTPPEFTPFILPSEFTPAMFWPKKRKVKRGGKKYGERLWYVGPLMPKFPKLASPGKMFKMPKATIPKMQKVKLPKMRAIKLPKMRVPRMKKMRRMV